ncbi:MAG: sigma-70 family RNA polymerase sigma factor, partial [Nitrospiraceae bacterium]|nr:sigma-70 family RNA polymerase sigma factor [Nitrospiraceae bacterium]
ELVGKFKQGDISAFEEIVLRYQDRIYNVCRGILADPHDAEDAAQEVFLKAFQSLGKFKPDAALYTWLYRIAVNTCLDYKKSSFAGFLKRLVADEELVKELPSQNPSPEQAYESKQIENRIARALKKLPKKLRAAIVLKELEGLSYEEIALILDISTGTVKSRISRARERLQELLKDFREQI